MTETVKRGLMMITALRNTVVIINLTLTKSRFDIFLGICFGEEILVCLTDE